MSEITELSYRLGAESARNLSAHEHTLHDETKAQIKALATINKLGFLTTDSQDGLISHGSKIPTNVELYHASIAKAFDVLREKDDVTDDEYRDAGEKVGRYYKSSGGKFKSGIEVSQRAYLVGLMNRDDADIFVHMLNWTDKVAYVDRIPVTYATGSSTGVLMKAELLYSRMNDQIVASTGLDAFDSEPRLHVENDLREILPRETYEALSEADKESFVTVKCFDARHGRKALSENGLFTDVIRALKKASRY